MKRENISSGSSYEALYGYSRAVRVGDTVYVAGTLGVDYATGAIPETAADQLRQAITTISAALAKAGCTLSDVVQLTTYITDPGLKDEIGAVLAEAFGEIRPTNTLLVVGLPFDNVYVEISAIAVVGCGDSDLTPSPISISSRRTGGAE